MGLTEERKRQARAVITEVREYSSEIGPGKLGDDAILLAEICDEVLAALAEAERERIRLEELHKLETDRAIKAEGEVFTERWEKVRVKNHCRELEEENARLRAALAREVGAFQQAINEGQVPGRYLTPEQAQQMREALAGLHRDHLVVDGDCWFSCPKSGRNCNDSLDKGVCDCGADASNERLAAIVSLVGGEE